MLAKLEALYLNILRVVVLVLATLLLIGAFVGGAVAASMLLSPADGETNARRLVQGDRLNDYLREQGAAPSEPSIVEGEAAPDAEDSGDERIVRAARNIAQYVRQTTGVPVVVEAAQGYIEEKAEELPSSLFDDYADSILKLSQDLLARRTQAAGAVDVDVLIEWHFARFSGAAEAAAQRDMENAQRAVERRIFAGLLVGVAGMMFGLFLLIVFAFVIIKIERNLRLLPVRLQQSGSGASASGAPEG